MANEFEVSFNFRTGRFNNAGVGLRHFYEVMAKDWDGAAVALSSEMQSFLKTVAGAIAQRNGQPWPGGTTEKTLSRRSGDLVNAIMGSVKVNGNTFDTIEGEIGAPGIKYARIQELGGTITPKKAKFLAIPLPAALSSTGIPLMPGPRDWPNTFCRKSKAGNLIIFQKRGTTIVPLYVLKLSVTIPPRLNMRTTLVGGVGYFVDRAADAILKAAKKST
jgi:hypothetical protein